MTYEGVHMNLDYIKGVNLGNWLVLEKWMNPALFDGTTADDEYYLPMTNTICRRNSIRPSTRPASGPTAPNTSTSATSPPSHRGD